MKNKISIVFILYFLFQIDLSAENLKIDLIKVNSFFLINQDLKKENYLMKL